MGLFDRGVKKTKEGFFQRLSRSIIGKSKVDDSVLDAIEEALVASDMGVDTTLKIVDSLEERVNKDRYMSFDELVDMLRDEIGTLLDIDGEESPKEQTLPKKAQTESACAFAIIFTETIFCPRRNLLSYQPQRGVQ